WMLVWKNFQKQKAYKLVLFLSIVLPVISFLLLFYFRSSNEQHLRDYSGKDEARILELGWRSLIDKINERRARVVEKQKNFKMNVFIPQIKVGFAPNSNSAIGILIEAAVLELSISSDQIEGFKDCDDLRAHASSEHYLASVCFRNVNADPTKNGLPTLLHFAIIMPSELRNYEQTWIGDSWKEINFLVNPESSDSEETEEESYADFLREGFVALQYYISAEYLRTATMGQQIPKVLLRRFNENANVLIFDRVATSAILLILLGFMFPVTVLVKLIVEEREVGQRFAMEANNASAAMQMVAWFFNGFLEFLVSCIFITCLLKIEWDGLAGVLEKSPWHILFFFFISYGFSVSSFVILMSSVMRNTKIAMVLVPIIWILVPLPFLSDEELISELPDIFYIVATVLLCNVSLSRGLKKFFYIEDFPREPKNSDFFDYKVMHSDYGLVVPFACFYIQALLCMLITLILETNACACFGGIFRKMRLKIRGIKLNTTEEAVERWPFKIQAGNDRRSTRLQKILSVGRKSTGAKSEKIATIEFRNVWKKFSKSFVVRNFTLSVYPGEVVALLGSNSSGKSTIIKMLCGLIMPSNGEVYISGHNVGTHRRQAFKNTGTSLSSSTLFSEFMVYDHLIFFCRLRGLKHSEARKEVRAFLRSLKIEELERTKVRKLTTGQKLLLQSLCAFVGGTRNVILDKPFDGVDEPKARLLFSFLQEQKKSRSIFFTTNSPKVASDLADRIAILSKGKLLSLGTEQSLCNTFNDSYRLTINANENCNFAEVHLFLEKYIADIEIDSSLGDTAVFLIKYKNQTELIALLEDLTQNKEELNIYSFQLQECSLEHILLNLFANEQSSFEFEDRRSLIFSISNQRQKRYILPIMHLWEVLRQRLITDFRNCFMPLLKFILPTLVAVWTLCMPYFWDTCQPPGKALFPIGDQGSGIVVLQQKSSEERLVRAGEEYVTSGAIEIKPELDITNYIRSYVTSHNLLSDIDFIAAAIISDGEVQALFNNKWPHSAPDSLALAMNSLAVGYLGSDSGIKVEIEPLPFSTVHTLQLHLNIDGIDLIFACSLSFSFCFIWSIPLLYMTLSRESRYNYFELVAGMRMSIMILAFLIYDIAVVSLAFLPLNIAVIFLQWDVLMNVDIFLLYAYVLVVVALCVLSINLLISIGKCKIHNCYLKVIAFYSFGIVIYLAVYETKPIIESNELFFLFLDFHPFYSLLHNLMRIASISEKMWLCSDVQICETSEYSEQCQKVPNCCDTRAQQFNYFRFLICVYLLTFVVWISIFISLKSKLVKRRPRQEKYFWDSDPDSQYDQNILHISQPNELENTWIFEKSRVRTLERSYIETKVLHVEHLSVLFGLRAALKHIDFMVNRYQVLSIFGENGSGKTILMKAILGIYSPSSGRIICSNMVPFKSENLEACDLIGYSAQEGKMFRTLTILESIRLILRVRRISRKTLKSDATTVCRIFGLYRYRFHLLSVCSQGILKRLSIAIALISDANLILLDDPFAQLDVISRRNMLHVIHDVCRRGHAVVYTCSDTDLSLPALRMAALSHPRIAAIGERQEMEQNHYSSYYVVETRIEFDTADNGAVDSGTLEREGGFEAVQMSKINQDSSRARRDSEDRWKYLKLCGLIEKVFPHAIVKTVRFPKACFWLSSHMYSMSQIVKTLQLYKHNFYSFSISQQPSVSSIFLTISPEKMQKETFTY
ncbi:phospholipid-transporting ATPase ABCA3, partial [Drosophila rhopaloa]|uniref:ABC transporter domain-containing protein n=2 Tax=Drosophila rhopaloa TaxID=1041015 RepID=A0ABM5GZD0_DRORH